MKRVVRDQDAERKVAGGTVIQEYFANVVPNLGLATALIEDVYPPKELGRWAVNELVDEMYFVVSGRGRVVFMDGEQASLERGTAVHMPRGVAYRVEGASSLYVVIPTGPAWSAPQHKYLEDQEG